MEYKYVKIGVRIAEMRKSKGWTQKDLIAKLDAEFQISVGRNKISRIEQGKEESFKKITVEFLEALCSLFECDMGYLLGEYDECKRCTSQYIHELTGLSGKSIDRLEFMKNVDIELLSIINLLLVNPYFTVALQDFSKAVSINRDTNNCAKKAKQLDAELEQYGMDYSDRHEYVQDFCVVINEKIKAKNSIDKIELSPYDAARFYYMAADNNFRSAIEDIKGKVENNNA